MQEGFEKWLRDEGQEKALKKIISRCKTVNKFYNLEKEYQKDKGQSLLDLLSYSKEDELNNNPPNHRIPIMKGDIKEGSNTLKACVNKYMQYKEYQLNSLHKIDEVIENKVSKKNLQLSDIEISEIKAPLQKIENNKDLPDDQKLVLIKYRLGQSKYRDKLIEYWEGCSICSCSNTQLLIASHIKPWNECNDKEKYDPYNGLLLTPNYDKLFDRHLITFTDSGEMLVSDLISEEDLEKLNISKTDTISSIKLTAKHTEYLSYHRQKYYQKNGLQ